MSTAIPTWDEIYKQQQDALATDKQKKKDETSALYDRKADVTQQQYDEAIKDTESGYASDYQKNAVQKIINEQQIAENMANMGITNSGLNRTQQTAAQLSYANQNANIDNNRRKALSDLSLSLASSLAAIEQDKIAARGQIDTDFDDDAAKQADTIYNSYVDMYEASQKSSGSGGSGGSGKPTTITKLEHGTYAGMKNGSNGNVIYTDIYGNTATMPKGSNPYTGFIHNDAKTGGVYDPSKVFGNGYQPNNFKGKPLTASGAEITIEGTNKPRNVWHTTGSNFYYWNGVEYVKLTVKEMVDVGVIPNIDKNSFKNGNLVKDGKLVIK